MELIKVLLSVVVLLVAAIVAIKIVFQKNDNLGMALLALLGLAGVMIVVMLSLLRLS